jgi:hypothetical protein
MKKILLLLKIIITNKKYNPFGSIKYFARLNPYNPLSYIFMLLYLPVALYQIGFKDTFLGIPNAFDWLEVIGKSLPKNYR